MNMLYDGAKEKGGLVLIPNSLADAFGGMMDFGATKRED